MIDLNAVLLCTALINIFLCIALFGAWRFQKVYAGFGFWVLANLSLALGHILLGWVRYVIPHLVIILTHNLLFVVAAWLRLEGLHRFLDLKRGWCPHFIGMAFFLGIMWWFSDDMAARTAVLCGLLACYLYGMAWVLFSQARGDIRLFYRLMAMVFLAYGLALTSRSILAVVAPPLVMLPKATLANISFFLSTMLLDIGVIFAFLMMNDKRMALELEATEERLVRVQGSIIDGFLVVDNDLRITHYNDAAAQVFGRRREEVLGQAVGDALPRAAGALLGEQCTGAIREKRFCSFETSFGETNHEGWYAVRIYPFVDGASVFLQDINARKRAEDDLLEARAELEKRVRDRTAELSVVNENLRREIGEHQRTEAALRESENRLRLLSSELLTSQERERKRISIELHDEMGQALTAIQFNLTEIETQLPPGVASAAREKLEETRTIIDQALSHIREISLFLRPSMLDDLGLVPTIRWHLSRFSRRTGVDVQFETAGLDERLDPDVETVVYRIFQESLNNVGRHAGARTVRVRLERTEERVAAEIEDNGAGFDVSGLLDREEPGTGIGLIGMQERASLVGGRLAIASRKGEGTRISLEIPLARGGA